MKVINLLKHNHYWAIRPLGGLPITKKWFSTNHSPQRILISPDSQPQFISTNKKFIPIYINSFTLLKKWVEQDLKFIPHKVLPMNEIKTKLSKIIFNTSHSNLTHQDIQKKITAILSADESSIYNHLKDLFIDCFFSKYHYEIKINYLKSDKDEIELNKKLKSLNHMHTLSFVSVLADDKRELTQVQRASVITKAALHLYLNFKNGQFNTHLNRQNSLSTHFYKYFFCSTVRTNLMEPTDELYVNYQSSHIVILFHGQIYKLNVIENNRCILTEEITGAIEEIIQLKTKIEYHLPIGAISSASRIKCFEIRRNKFHQNEETFNCLETAIFILCLDDISYLDTIAENMFAYQFHNRYFNNTQIIIGKKGECGIINNYINIEGMPAIEIVDTIYQESLKIDLLNQKKLKFLPEKFELNLDVSDLKVLENDTKKIIHDQKSSYHLEIGRNFFKEIELSPNITFNFLLMLSVYEISNILPVTNHAISRREDNNITGQLDWIYVCPEKLETFINAVKSCKFLNFKIEMRINQPDINIESHIPKKRIIVFPVNQNWHYLIMSDDINFSPITGILSEEKLKLSLNAEISNLSFENNQYILTPKQKAQLICTILTSKKCIPTFNDFYSLLKDAVEYHKEKISLSKKGLSPTSFFYKPEGEIFDQLSDFYLYFGQYSPAFRNYLFRTYRNNQSIDIITSSLKLPNSIKTIGRHGTCSEIFTMFGLHILMQENRTELVFIPNKAWLYQLNQVVEKINDWSVKIYLIAQTSVIPDLKETYTFKK